MEWNVTFSKGVFSPSAGNVEGQVQQGASGAITLGIKEHVCPIPEGEMSKKHTTHESPLPGTLVCI